MKRFLAALTLLASTTVLADILPYTDATFEQLMNDGKPILVDVTAAWCGTCKKQNKVINRYLDNNDTDLTVLKVDYDEQKEAVKRFKAPRQSTLVLFDNGVEIDRMIAVTRSKKLNAFFAKAN